jgi:hypothetical protein
MKNHEFNSKILQLFQITEERKPLSIAARRKKAQTLRRLKALLQRRREQMEKRVAPEKNLESRASRLAWKVAKKRFAGKKGLDYNKLSDSQKIAIDALVYKKVKAGTIKKVAKRLMQMVRRREMNRVKSARGGKKSKKEKMPSIGGF